MSMVQISRPLGDPGFHRGFRPGQGALELVVSALRSGILRDVLQNIRLDVRPIFRTLVATRSETATQASNIGTR